ncbi:hypothetical protein PF010_g454 [Phytophthora fragariae]|uniref:Uncharacterized protein n=1 Tax=Phytophthora fragariae TaxID=53985 RepID=A0A6A3FYJ4_9STRA|nr:hypothetical protein PF003_g9981 [Phytophthora fragariae]KAE8949943.1 hypothetical protein PF009_g502 [Phytophthora fragariae]KAE9139744.1 hypothetical protein PF010_g454 [Phytophthora fragariae]KAE9140774.1 hypothetical protein PF007_g505 [Phytophthora fragariae]KAE9155712.1 hypothetical protein PF006_g336 [Phytophthora fragariae]
MVVAVVVALMLAALASAPVFAARLGLILAAQSCSRLVAESFLTRCSIFDQPQVSS